MFDTVQKYRTPFTVLLGIISVSFVVFGVTNMPSAGKNYLTRVGDQEITLAQLNEYAKNTQAPATPEARAKLLENLVQRAYLIEAGKQMGVAPSEEQLKQYIVKVPAFQENGQFSEAKYHALLKQSNLSETAFLNDIKNQYYTQAPVNLIGNGQLVSDAQAQQWANLNLVVRKMRRVNFEPGTYAAALKPADAQLQSYYDAHKAQYQQGEAVKFDYVALTPQDLLKEQTVTEAEAKTWFDAHQKDAPQRDIAHILVAIKPDATPEQKAQAENRAKQILAFVKAHPEQFAQIAQRASDDPGSARQGGDLGFISQDGKMVPEFEKAAFALGAGKISDLVKTQFGLHILRNQGEIGHKDFAADKNAIMKLLKTQKSQDALKAAREKLKDSAAKSADLGAVAQAMGLKVQSFGEFITAQEAQKRHMPEELDKALFSDEVLKNKKNSAPIEVGDGLWVVRAKETKPAAQLTFAQAKNQVDADWRLEEGKTQAKNAAQQAFSRLQKGEKVELKWSDAAEMAQPQIEQQLPPEDVKNILALKPAEGKPAYALLTDTPVPMLVAVDSMNTPKLEGQELQNAKQQAQQMVSGGIFQDYLQWLATQFKRVTGNQKLDAPG